VLIIDSQIHPYAPRNGEAVTPAGQRMMTPDAIIAEMDRAGVDRAVLVPPRVDVATTNEYAKRAAQEWPGRFGVMGKLLLDRPESPGIAAAWTAADMLGFRVSFPRDQFSPADTDWLWRSAEERDFAVMVWAPGQLSELKDAARRHPRARIIVDHLGMGPDDIGDRVGESIRNLLPLAELDNVAVKASSLAAHSTMPYPFEDLHAHVRDVVSGFGGSRVFWGSDLTTLKCAYTEAVRMFTDAMPFLAADVEQIMGSGIAKWLRWKV
jgi:predicted TIM-barrel fold metal-dependent hydrolase